MLRPAEHILYLPDMAPSIEAGLLARLRPREGEIIAVADPPRLLTAGGVHLHARGDGWSDPHTDGQDLAEDKFLQAHAEFEEAKRIADADPLSLDAKKRVLLWYAIAKASYETMIEMEQMQNPGAALDLRPDAATVVRSGVPQITEGDRIIVAPYAAWRFMHLLGASDVLIIGADDPWDEIVPLVWNPLSAMWELTSNWVSLELAENRHPLSRKASYRHYGEVIATGPDAYSQIGDTVLLAGDRLEPMPDNCRWFVTRFGSWDRPGVIMVREIDGDGVRRVLATVVE